MADTFLYIHVNVCLEGGPLFDVTPLPALVCTEVKVSSSVTGLVYDQMMMLHHNMWDR